MVYQESLSISRRYTWNSCKRKYDYQYNKKLKTLPSDLPFEQWERFGRGNAIHSVMESAFLGEPLEKGIEKVLERFERDGLDDTQRAAIPQLTTSAMGVAKSVIDWLPISDWEVLKDKHGSPLIEAKLTAPLPGFPGGFLGYADLIAMHKPSGLRFILDYKTRASFEQNADAGMYDLQLASYQHCAKHMGIEVHGTALIEIKPDLPKRKPQYTRIDTGDFTGVRESEDGRIRFTPTFRSDILVDALWADLSKEAESIWKHSKDPRELFRNPSSYNCSSCKYRRPCFASANGEDAKYVLDTEYQVTIGD